MTLQNNNSMKDVKTELVSLHFGEIAVIDKVIHNYEEVVSPEGEYSPMERRVTPMQSLLLKIASAYLEAYESRYDLDVSVPVPLTTEELWTLREKIDTNMSYIGVPIGYELKRKILSALLSATNDITSDFELSDIISTTEE